ncbi:MAG: DNA translocase FtsK 4TM domain-containing protein [bacterium]
MKNIKGIIIGIALVSLSLLLLIAILGFWNVRPADWRIALSANNPIGPVGSYIAGFLILSFGIGSIFIPIGILCLGIAIMREKTFSYFKIISFAFLILTICILFSPLSNPTREFSLFKGGWIGFKTSYFLLQWLHLAGSYIVIISMLIILSLYLSGGAILFPFRSFSIPKVKKEYPKKEEPKQEKKKEKPRIVLSSERKEIEEIREKESPTSFQLPPLSLLSEPVIIPEKEIKEDLLTLSKQLEDTLSQFKIEAKVVCINRGPTVTSFEVQPAAGVRVSSISGLSNDIALALAAQAVRIEAPIPGKSAIGIEIPNHKIQAVFLKEGLSGGEFKKKESLLSFFLGKDITGEPIIVNLAGMPHLLVAGVTGSGKSVCLASIITSFLYKASPQQLRLVLIDPKRVEMTIFKELPHLLTDVICDSKKAIITLHWLLKEMDERYKTFAYEGVRDIDGYHKKKGELPYIVVVIDELADLMAVSLRSCEEALTRLSQMARAVGIHLIVATQRPSVDIITGLIKANFPSRIAFQVFSRVDSRTILDMMGAEKLLGRGDMLFFPAGAPKPMRLQGAYISLPEIERIVDFIKEQGISLEKKEIREEEIKEGFDEDEEIDDSLYEQAISIVEDAGYGSTSMIQRKLKIGYNRAARLIERMEEEGIVSPPDGSKPRKVLR